MLACFFCAIVVRRARLRACGVCSRVYSGSCLLCTSVIALISAECVQRPGDIVYVPSGWIHATVNIGDTAAVAQQVREFPPNSARFKGNLSSALMKEATLLR